MIIDIEGIDGAGKTTQCEMLKKWLKKEGRCVTIVKDLDSTMLGKRVREVLTSNVPRCPEVEMFSFLACKTQLFTQVITPLLSTGGIVICDRGVGSFLTYFETLGLRKQFLLDSIQLAIKDHRPVVTILLDITPEEAVKRKLSKPQLSKFDLMGSKFFQKQRLAFLKLHDSSPSWFKVNGLSAQEEIHSSVVNHIKKFV